MLFSDPEEAKIKAKIWLTKLCMCVSENEWLNHLETSDLSTYNLYLYLSISFYWFYPYHLSITSLYIYLWPEQWASPGSTWSWTPTTSSGSSSHALENCQGILSHISHGKICPSIYLSIYLYNLDWTACGMFKSFQPYKIFGCYRFCQSKMAKGSHRATLSCAFYFLFSLVRLLNTLKHVKDLYVILWLLYCLKN